MNNKQLANAIEKVILDLGGGSSFMCIFLRCLENGDKLASRLATVLDIRNGETLASALLRPLGSPAMFTYGNGSIGKRLFYIYLVGWLRNNTGSLTYTDFHVLHHEVTTTLDNLHGECYEWETLDAILNDLLYSQSNQKR